MVRDTEKLINVKDLSYAYPGRDKILDDFSFVLKKGEKIALIGSTGCGKSTFLKILMGLLKAPKGSIRLFSKAMNSEKDFADVRTRIGFFSRMLRISFFAQQ
jgi:cobalt/nickel transport system ATP-binding protein